MRVGGRGPVTVVYDVCTFCRCLHVPSIDVRIAEVFCVGGLAETQCLHCFVVVEYVVVVVVEHVVVVVEYVVVVVEHVVVVVVEHVVVEHVVLVGVVGHVLGLSVFVHLRVVNL